jgi:hypothetical protein
MASGPFDVHALIIGHEGARYLKGVPTLDLDQQRGAIQLRQQGFYNNRPVFAIAFYNAGPEPVNIGLEDIHVSSAGSPLEVFSVQELERQAKKKAWWNQFGMALLGGLSAGVAASQRNTYHSTISGPYGTYSVHASYPSLAGQLQSYQIQRDTSFGIAAIQYQLDRTIELINYHVVQRTTVDPGSTYGGLIVLDKLKKGDPPFELRVDEDWYGERYPFAFLIQKPGRPVPEQYSAMLALHAKPKALSPRVLAAAAADGAAMQPRRAAATKVEGAIFLRSGVVKVPAKSKSGYCLRVPADYVSTGTKDFPIITRAMPLCEQDAE